MCLRPFLVAALLAVLVPASAVARPVATETFTMPDARSPTTPAVPADAAVAEPEVPQVFYDPAPLPAPVRRLREQLIDAAKSGDIGRLQPILDGNDYDPDFGFDPGEDPIATMKENSADGEGREILAILLEVLEAGYVHVDVGTSEEMYIWPYFARYPISALTGPQIVELFKILTGGDYADMIDAGGYFFFRVGIAPDGTWRYFNAGG